MSKLTASTDIDRFEAQDAQVNEALKYATLALEQVGQLLNNGLGFADNFNAKLLAVTFSAGNTDVASLHGLGRVPQGYFQVGQTAASLIYDGSSANTSSLLYLRASAA